MMIEPTHSRIVSSSMLDSIVDSTDDMTIIGVGIPAGICESGDPPEDSDAITHTRILRDVLIMDSVG
jgi:hypothetical protein